MNTPIERPKRKLTKEEDNLRAELWGKKLRHQDTHAFVTTTEPLPLRRWNGNHPYDENTTTSTVPAGATLKIVMVSRMGDVGLTDDLTANNGYCLRLDWEDAAMTNIRRNP